MQTKTQNPPPRAPRPWVWLAATTLGLILAVYGVARVLIDGSFERLERQEVQRSVALVTQALETDNVQIEIVSRDYARWDDMYDFVSSLDPAFADGNFNQAGLTEQDIDLAAVFLPNGTVRFSVERQGEEYYLPARKPTRQELEAAWGTMLKSADVEGGIRYLWLAGRPMIVTLHQITHSDRSGPYAGSLLFARAIEADDLARLSARSKLPVMLAPVADASALAAVPEQVRSRIETWQAESPALQLPVSDTQVSGYTVVDGLDGAPGLVLGTRIARSVLLQGRQTRTGVVAAVGVLVTLFAILANLLLTRNARAARAARANEARYRAVLSGAEESILLFDPETRRIVEVNAALERLAARSSAQLVGATVDELFDRSGSHASFEQVRLAALETREPREAQLRRPDGTLLDVELTVSLLASEAEHLNCLIVRDVSPRKRAEEQQRAHHRSLEHLAHHDALTGLPNRLYLNRRLPELLESARREQGSLGLCYLDFDHFKTVNDLAGHHVGDQLLKEFARLLQEQVRPRDMVFRMGGDEFVIISRSERANASFEALASRIVAALQVPMRVGARSIPATASIGVCAYPRDAADVVTLLQCADLALYGAKRSGRNRYQCFEPAMVDQTRERIALEQELRRAVEGEGIIIHLQPIVELSTRRVVGFEALARWTHPELGEIPPARFIPVAEESGLISELGVRVLRLAATHLAQWRRAGLEVVPIHVNVSARQFERGSLAEQVTGIAREFQLPTTLLHIELTESAVMSTQERHVEALRQLRQAGIRVSIDDFGTGYSSLAYLKHLPIDYLKIDRSFVNDMTHDANDEAIVAAVIGMAQKLRMQVIAEGVETEEQADRLRALGCEYAQGYHFGKPLPAEHCARFLEELAQRDNYSETLRLRVIDGRKPPRS